MSNSTNQFKLYSSKSSDIAQSEIKEKKTSKRKSVLDELAASNVNKNIKIRARKLKNGNYSLYLHKRYKSDQEYDYLRIYITNQKDKKSHDREKIKLAESLRDKKELKLYQDDHDFELKNESKKANFVKYFDNLVKSKKSSIKPWQNTYKHLLKFTNGKISFRDVDEVFCEKFKDYLLSKVNPNSAHTYFARLKASLYHAVKIKLIKRNPAQFIHVKKQEVEREFLTEKEMAKLIKAPCKNEQTKRAFLFGCFTGLRFSDISELTFDDIQDDKLVFRQSKTKGMERNKLNKNAMEIIQRQINDENVEGRLFNLQSHSNTQLHIKDWIEKAKIKKNITWHSGRHTHACMLLNNDVDLYTVSKLLGHREIKTTQIYAKLIDKKKDEAIDKLPNFDLK